MMFSARVLVVGFSLMTIPANLLLAGSLQHRADTTLVSSDVAEDELWLYPSTSLSDVIDRQPGIVDGHPRGGRSGEIGFYYGGFPINNPFFGRTAFEVEPNMISGLEVRPGIVDSRHGYGMSGAVVFRPEDVPASWSGRFFGHLGAAASTREQPFIQREQGAGSPMDVADFEVVRVPYNETVGYPGTGDLQMNLAGPLLGSRIGVVLSGRFYSDDGHMVARRLFNPTDGITAFPLRPRTDWIVRSTGDESFLQLGSEERLTVAARVQMNVLPGIDLNYDGTVQDARRRPYDHRQKYVPDGTGWALSSAQFHAAELVYAPGSSTTGRAAYAYLADTRRARLYDAPTDTRYVFRGPGTGVNAFDAGGNDVLRERTAVRTHMVGLSAAHRILNRHEVWAGVEARLHQLDHHETQVVFAGPDAPQVSADPLLNNRIDVTPTELSAFVGARVQIERVTVEGGVRSSTFDPAVEVPLDWLRADQEYLLTGVGSQAPIQDDSLRNRRDADVQSWLSPRLQLSFPFSDETRLRFGAAMMYQMPALALLYHNMEYERDPTSPWAGYGNPGLEPERTLHVEMGLAHRIGERLGIEVALFGKDVKNVAGQQIERNVLSGVLVTWLDNVEVAHIRGATLSLFQPGAEARKFSWSLDYSLLYAEGSASAYDDRFNRMVAGIEGIHTAERLEWDRRHVLDNTILWRPSTGLSIALINRLQSPLPYQVVVGTSPGSPPHPEYLSRTDDTPVELKSDIRVWYDVQALPGSTRFFLQIDNVTDARISRSVFSDTGMSADLYERGRHVLFRGEVEGVNTIQEFSDDRYYISPRTVRLGLVLGF